jgi:CheY-like chemotaxis protein
MLVEDDSDIRQLFTAGLAMYGCDVITAGHGRDALARLAIDPVPDVIIADLHMPVMDGWQFLTELHGEPRLSKVPVIVLTAADNPARAAPRPETMLIKPVSIDHLVAAIKSATRSVEAEAR